MLLLREPQKLSPHQRPSQEIKRRVCLLFSLPLHFRFPLPFGQRGEIMQLHVQRQGLRDDLRRSPALIAEGRA